jgi:hypothetical protein
MSRKRGSCWFGHTVLLMTIVCLAVGIAAAQSEPTDTYQVDYYSNVFAPVATGTVHIVNPGTALTKLNPDGKPLNGSGNLCANIFVYNNDEQVVECCSCLLTPDSERTLSINGNLLGNPINSGNVTADGVIKIISTAPVKGVCPLPTGDTTITPTAGLRAWAANIQVQGTGSDSAPYSYPETEEAFAAAPLTGFEFEYNETECSAIGTSGSGPGICSCGTGD